MSSSDILIYLTLLEGTGSKSCADRIPCKSPLAPKNPAPTKVDWVIVIVLPPLYFFCTPENKSDALNVKIASVEDPPKVPAAKVIVSLGSYKLPVDTASIDAIVWAITVTLNVAPEPPPDVDVAETLE